jgi:hypothetical protein
VYGWDTLVLLKHYVESGLSKTAIARQLGVSRRVIYHWITTGQLDREVSGTAPARCRASRGTKLALPAADSGAAGDLSGAVGRPPARGVSRRGVRGRVQPAEGLRGPHPPAA